MSNLASQLSRKTNTKFTWKPLYLGLVFSLFWHIFLVSIFVPVVKNPVSMQKKCELVFLGSILQQPDFIMPLGVKKAGVKKFLLSYKDFSESGNRGRGANSFYKPQTQMNSIVIKRDEKVFKQPLPLQYDKDISFGFLDYSEYVYGVDFSDLKKRGWREDLAAHIDFKILFFQNGEVKAIKKMAGSGDPVLDLAILLRLKSAVFKRPVAQKDEWINVRFRIR